MNKLKKTNEQSGERLTNHDDGVMRDYGFTAVGHQKVAKRFFRILYRLQKDKNQVENIDFSTWFSVIPIHYNLAKIFEVFVCLVSCAAEAMPIAPRNTNI